MKLCLALKPFPANKGETIYNEGDMGREMYIITSGSVIVTQNRHKDKANILKDGSYFGMDQMLEAGSNIKGEGMRRRETVVTAKESEFAILERTDFWNLLKQFPEMLDN